MLKALLEVYRDTANLLDADKTRLADAQQDAADIRDQLTRLEKDFDKELDEKDKLKTELKATRNRLEIEKAHLEKVRRHRDELAEELRKYRKDHADPEVAQDPNN